MMKQNSSRFLLSLFLIVLGSLVLLNNLNLLPFGVRTEQWFWFSMFALGGLVFLYVYMTNRLENWWAVIPSFTLLGLAFLIGDFLSSSRWDMSWLGGGIFLGSIGLSFLVILFTRREYWWATIPAGTLLSLAAVTIVSGTNFLGEEQTGLLGGATLFLGLAVTFLAVYLRPLGGDRQVWALWPMSILGVMGLLLLAGATNLMAYILGAILILVGVGLMVRAVRRSA